MSSYGFGRLSNLATSQERKGNHVVFALLDTPLGVCIHRIHARRAAKATLKGKESKPFDPQNLSPKYHGTHKDQKHLADAGYDCRMLSYQDPLPPVLQWLGLEDSAKTGQVPGPNSKDP